jgi:heme-binding NEAT domain protein
MTTSVTRDVYTADGKLLYHDVWYSSYRAEPKLVRIAPPKKKPKNEQPATTTTDTTTDTTTPTTTQTTTQPSG